MMTKAEFAELCASAAMWRHVRDGFCVMSLDIDGLHYWTWRGSCALLGRGPTIESAVSAAMGGEAYVLREEHDDGHRTKTAAGLPEREVIEQTELHVGDKLRDNDPRMNHRAQLTVTHILPNGVQAQTGRGQAVMILRRRIYTDGKPRRNGFSLVRDAR